MTDDRPPVPFSLGMYSVSGSPAFAALVFDDGAAVALNSVASLIVKLGLSLPTGSVFDLLQGWDRTLPQLVTLVDALAYDDMASGQRSTFQSEEFLQAERLLPEARQIYRLREKATLVPPSALGASTGKILLDENLRKGRVNLCLGAVMGRMCHRADTKAAGHAIAGWTLATEIVRPDRDDLTRNSAPGSLFLGPWLVPHVFAGSLTRVPYLLALMANTVQEGTLEALATSAPERIAQLSRETLLLPGDVVVFGGDPAPAQPDAQNVDVIEAVASGFGRQIISMQ